MTSGLTLMAHARSHETVHCTAALPLHRNLVQFRPQSAVEGASTVVTAQARYGANPHFGDLRLRGGSATAASTAADGLDADSWGGEGTTRLTNLEHVGSIADANGHSYAMTDQVNSAEEKQRLVVDGGAAVQKGPRDDSNVWRGGFGDSGDDGVEGDEDGREGTAAGKEEGELGDEQDMGSGEMAAREGRNGEGHDQPDPTLLCWECGQPPTVECSMCGEHAASIRGTSSSNP